MSPDQTQPPNELLVALVQGRDLLAKDMNLFSANTSDPVVRLSCLGQREKSRVVKGTCTPWWNQTFSLPIEFAADAAAADGDAPAAKRQKA